MATSRSSCGVAFVAGPAVALLAHYRAEPDLRLRQSSAKPAKPRVGR
ncbi:hypothetical protein JFT91_21820 [Pseudomonas sp. TH08]|nr:hypothetical protein [Pseudomonas sp. TH08]MBK5535193.1 hypothetical protein [Pseudomonas sp. TH08]